MYQPCSSTAATTRREWATAGDDTAHARNSGGLAIDSAAVSLHQIQLSDIVDTMVEVVRTDDFDEWLTKLKDRAGRLRILKRIDRLANGNPGDVKPVGKNKIAVCTNLPCALRDGDRAGEYLKRKLGVDYRETTADGQFTLVEGECMGACGDSPVLIVNNKHMCVRMTDEKLDALVAALKVQGESA